MHETKLSEDLISLIDQPMDPDSLGVVRASGFLENPLDRKVNKMIKRSFDIMFSLAVMLLIISWLIPVLAVFIKLTSKGPVFFVQPRTGFNNKTFMCWKLRTMFTNDDAHVKQAVKHDPRITFAGRLLRKFSLDELPQFYNVLKGEMSLIGPRPHMLKHTEEYAREQNSYLQRHAIKPGITGLSQIMGYRGEIHHPSALNKRVRIDIFYMKKWSFTLDMIIIFRTVKLLLLGDKNAY